MPHSGPEHAAAVASSHKNSEREAKFKHNQRDRVWWKAGTPGRACGVVPSPAAPPSSRGDTHRAWLPVHSLQYRPPPPHSLQLSQPLLPATTSVLAAWWHHTWPAPAATLYASELRSTAACHRTLVFPAQQQRVRCSGQPRSFQSQRPAKQYVQSRIMPPLGGPAPQQP